MYAWSTVSLGSHLMLGCSGHGGSNTYRACMLIFPEVSATNFKKTSDAGKSDVVKRPD